MRSPSLELGAEIAVGRLATVRRGSLQGRAVAVKRARPEVRGAAEALRREARILGAVDHPAVVPLLDVLDDPRAPALVLGWADGGSLADLLADGPPKPDDLLHLLRPVAGGLDALHAAGVAHLDVTAGNVLLAAAGPILIDPAPPGAGTPGYADPVVVAGGPPSARSDVYGLAACAHHALTGRLPRRAGGVAAGVDLPAPVAEVLDTALAADHRRRPATASAFVTRLEAALRGAPPAPARRLGRPVVRAPQPPADPPRTWPFDRWQEEASAAEERQASLAALLTENPPPRRRRRVLILAAVLAAAAAATAGAAASGASRAAEPPAPVRTSAPDSTQRPPAPRPPPTTNPGGRT